MWNRVFGGMAFGVLLLSMRLVLEKRRFRFFVPFVPITLFALHGLLLAFVPLFSIIRGKYGNLARAALDSADAILLGIISSEPYELVNIDIHDEETEVMIRIKLV